MRDEDKAIWERFIIANPDYFEVVEYDVAVGSPPEFSTEVSPNTGGDDGVLYKKKIDVVGHKGGQKYIIELKPRAGPPALGQVLGYAILYRRDIDPIADVVPMVITDQISPDVAAIAEQMGVLITSA